MREEIYYGSGDFEKDMKDVIELCGTWWEDSLFYKKYGIRYEVHEELFLQCKDAGILVYTCGRTEEGKLVSCYVGVKSPYMFNKNVMSVAEIVWCVRKENRSFRALIGLVKAIENLMKEENADHWNLNVSNEPHYDNTVKFLENNGYVLMDKCCHKYKENKNG